MPLDVQQISASGQVAFAGSLATTETHDLTASGQVAFSGGLHVYDSTISASGQVAFSGRLKPPVQKFWQVSGVGTSPWDSMYWDMTGPEPVLKDGIAP